MRAVQRQLSVILVRPPCRPPPPPASALTSPPSRLVWKPPGSILSLWRPPDPVSSGLLLEQFAPACKSQLFHFQACCKLVVKPPATWNKPWRGHLHHGNGRLLQIKPKECFHPYSPDSPKRPRTPGSSLSCMVPTRWSSRGPSERSGGRMEDGLGLGDEQNLMVSIFPMQILPTFLVCVQKDLLLVVSLFTIKYCLFYCYKQ